MERYFDLVDDKGVHIQKDVVFPSLGHAYESYFKAHPEGLPEGWRIVDTSKPIIEKYVSAIKKLKPFFRKLEIEVYYEDVKYFRSDMYLIIPFRYRGKEYLYRESLASGDPWIEEYPWREKEGVDKDMLDKAQVLVNELKSYYNKGDIPSAYSCWCSIYDLFEPNENMTWQEKETLFKEQAKYMSQISDEAVFTITDYGREKCYIEQGYYGTIEHQALTRVGIVYNYKGLCESNYIYTRADAAKNISTWLGEQESNKIIDKLEKIGFAAGEASVNKTYEFYDISDDEKLRDFLNGEYNENILETCLGNYDDLLSVEDNYKQYSDWYWQLEAVSKEYDADLGQYVGIAHSIIDYEEFKRFLADKEKSLDSVINRAIDESAVQQELNNDISMDLE